MHMVASPYSASRWPISRTSVPTSRAPLLPSGWPSAIAPPLTLTFSSSSPSSRMHASDCEAKASLSSTMSMSDVCSTAFSSAFIVCETHRLGFALGHQNGNDLFGEPPRLLRDNRALVAAKRECVLVLARHLVLLRNALGGLAHLQRSVPLGHLRVDEPPAEGCVVCGLRASRKRSIRLGHHPWRAGHALDAAGDHDLGGAGLDFTGGGDGCLHARPAQSVHGLPRHLDRKACEQERHARDIAVVFARAVRAAENHVLHLGRFDARALAHFLEHDRGEVVS